MDNELLKSEKKIIIDECRVQNATSICSLDLSPFSQTWLNPIDLKLATSTFDWSFQNWGPGLLFPPLQFNIIKDVKTLNKRISIFKINGTKFILKEEEYEHPTDYLLHELFVGIQLNKFLNESPFFVAILGGFSGSPSSNESSPCQFRGKNNDNVNYLMYQYISGMTLQDALQSNTIEPNEGWYLIKIVWDALQFANSRCGFIHQGCHLRNIILRPLDQYYSISIRNKKYVSRFLPIIIDYGRSMIEVNGKVFSPTNKQNNIPATTPLHDLGYLLFAFRQFLKSRGIYSPKGTKKGCVFAEDEEKQSLTTLCKYFEEKLVFKPPPATANLTMNEPSIKSKYPPCERVNFSENDYQFKVRELEAIKRKSTLSHKIIINRDYTSLKNDLLEFISLVRNFGLEITTDELDQLKSACRENIPDKREVYYELRKLI